MVSDRARVVVMVVGWGGWWGGSELVCDSLAWGDTHVCE